MTARGWKKTAAALASAAGAVSWLAVSVPAAARSTARLPYARAEVWATVIRLLRVNGNLPIREKDEAAGYVLFDYLDGAKSYRASFELVPAGETSPAAATDVIVTIPELPRRFEVGLVARLTQKLRDERGPGSLPPAPADRAPAPAKPAPDAGAPPSSP